MKTIKRFATMTAVALIGIGGSVALASPASAGTGNMSAVVSLGKLSRVQVHVGNQQATSTQRPSAVVSLGKLGRV